MKTLIGALALFAVGFGATFWLLRSNGLGNVDPVVVLKHKALGIAYLENNELEKAQVEFEALTKLLPDERLSWQNLLITRVMIIDPIHMKRSEEADKFREGIKNAEKALNELLARFPDEFESHFLAGRFYNSLREIPTAEKKALEAFAKATTIAPDSAISWFGLFEAGRYSSTSNSTTESNRGLIKAAEFAKTNLHVAIQLLSMLAKTENQQFKSAIPAAKQLAAPFVEKIKSFANVDINELADEALAAAENGEWSLAFGRAGQFGNMLRREVATQNDAKRINPHVLEFVVHSFSSDIEEQLESKQPTAAEATLVKFESTPLVRKKVAKQIELADFDLDGSLEAVLVTAEGIEVYKRGDDASWKMCAEFKQANVSGIALFDVDRDEAKSFDGECWTSDVDLVAWSDEGIFLLRNQLVEANKTRAFLKVDQQTEFAALKNVSTVQPVDLDHDGDLDLAIASERGISFWLNQEDLTFLDNSKYSVLPEMGRSIHTIIPVDWGRNVATDLLCLGEGVSGYLENILHGQFRWQSFSIPNLAVSRQMAILEADGNFSWDIAHVGEKGLQLVMTNNPSASVTKVQSVQSLGTSSLSGLLVADYDNDGYQDIIAWENKSIFVFRGGPAGQFQFESKLQQEMGSQIISVDVGDTDNDGDLDLAVACADGIELLVNQGGNANNSISVAIRGEENADPQKPSERVNILGFGSLVELQSGSIYQAQVVSKQRVHFGLGKYPQPQAVRVLWTNGIPEHIIKPEVGKPICLQQDLKGSCPYLYTWDGEKFSFYTDCLWAAPIGLQLADGVQARPREWEYLKVDGKALKAKDGEYIIRLTEELWEIGYFDQVELMQVLRPKNVQVYSNEKVGPGSIAEFKLHVVSNPRTPVRAVDQKNRDVLRKIAKRDDQYLQAFDQRYKQGLTEPHFVELDLGDLGNPNQVTLFLTGWIRPTDTSLNIAISQRPDLEPTQPPSIWVPNKNGEWVEASPFIGFPGGKTKTIAIDLSETFVTNDFRVRVATTMEIYWDHIFFSVDEPQVELKSEVLPITAANFRYRGFSKKLEHNGLGPENYDYSQVSTIPKWPPMEGRLTAYGDVLNLVAKADNRMVTAGAGDELEIRFKASAKPIPDGWEVEFILHNVGWDKDADLNTVFGQHVDPLPFAEMRTYPDPKEDKFAPFANQTRIQDRARFWRLLAP